MRFSCNSSTAAWPFASSAEGRAVIGMAEQYIHGVPAEQDRLI
jgi:hypothetical protein